MQRTIVTGGCGFIGSYIVKELARQGYEVVVIDSLLTGKKENIDPSIPLIEADIQNIEQILPNINEGDIIFHLAALTSVPESIANPLPYHETNITGTYNVYEAARIKKARGIIFSSSAAVYGTQEGILDETAPVHPESPYAFQKMFGELLGEHYSAVYKIPHVSLRYFNVYGKGNHEEGSYAPVTARLLKAKREGTPLPIIGDGEQTRDFIHVEDVAKANVLAIELLKRGVSETLNISSGVPNRIIDIAKAIGGNIIHHPPRVEIKHSCGNPEKAFKIMNFKPEIAFDKGLQKLLQS